MPAPRPNRTHIARRPLSPETQMMSHGYDPALSEGSVKPPVFLTPFFGTEFLIPPRGETNRQHGLALHLGWTNPWQDATSVVDYRPGYGALSVQLGYRARFGGLDR